MKPTPWYKNFWPWFLISFPLAAIIGCAGLIYMAIGNGPDMVVDDYYKKGKAINLELSKFNKAKALYLGYIVKRLLDVSIGSEKPTDRDSYAYKRIEVSGLLLKKLFREYYKLQQDNIYLKIDKEYFYKHNQTSYNGKDFVNLIVANKVAFFQDRIVETGFKKAFKGDWG